MRISIGAGTEQRRRTHRHRHFQNVRALFAERDEAVYGAPETVRGEREPPVWRVEADLEVVAFIDVLQALARSGRESCRMVLCLEHALRGCWPLGIERRDASKRLEGVRRREVSGGLHLRR